MGYIKSIGYQGLDYISLCDYSLFLKEQIIDHYSAYEVVTKNNSCYILFIVTIGKIIMNKKGFTLIELLAVIVILAVIAIIVTPVVTGIISKAKLSADMRSAEGYVKAAEDYFADSQINEEKKNNLGTNIADEIEISGNKPNGELVVNEQGKVSMAININNKCYKKLEDSNEITVADGATNCSLFTAVVPPDSCFDTSENEDGTLTITKYKCGNTLKSGDIINYVFIYNNDGEYTNIVIPDQIASKDVTSIGDNAFSPVDYNLPDLLDFDTKKGINSVIFSNNIKTINQISFAANEISKITLSNSIKTIGNGAFTFNKIENLLIPNNVVTIGKLAFNNNLLNNDQEFIYARNDNNGDGIISEEEIDKTTIIGYAGKERNNVIIPDGTVNIGDVAFSQNNILNITIPDSVSSLGINAFYANKFTSVNIPTSITDFCYRFSSGVTIYKNVVDVSSVCYR